MRIVEGGGATMKRIEIDGKMNKVEGDKNSNGHSKFKKVEMPMFSGTDTNSWLFGADWYFQVHKLTDFKRSW